MLSFFDEFASHYARYSEGTFTYLVIFQNYVLNHLTVIIAGNKFKNIILNKPLNVIRAGLF